jgi:uncharacterized membrane protein YagU involved in acid resistance
MAMAQRIQWSRVFTQALAAGITGAIFLDVYLWLTTILPQHGSLIAAWQFVASATIGNVAFSSTSYAGLGLVVHVLVSVAWAGGYAYLAMTRPFMNQRWVISGLVYGIIVYLFMQVLLLGASKFQFPPTPVAFVNVVIAHMVFFGLPVAFVVSRMNR